MVYVCFMGKGKELKQVNDIWLFVLRYYSSIIHLFSYNLYKRNVYLKFKKISISFFILWGDIFRQNFCHGPPFSLLQGNEEKKEAYMREQKTQSLQNRFSAYVVVAVSNCRARYLENKNRTKEREYAVLGMLDRTYTDFSEEYNKYVMDQILHEAGEISKLEQIISLTQGQKMIYAIACLKDREKALIFGRVFEELEFEELGKRHGISGKQAEMAYYYVIRKIRKRMEGTKDGI